jgi:hypothetical protein
MPYDAVCASATSSRAPETISATASAVMFLWD